jgi:tetratricopeptide (TPR) repeat protein
MPRKKRPKNTRGAEVAVPAQLPPIAELDEMDEYAPGHRPQTWLWTLLTALVVVMVVVYLLVLGTKAIYDGLRDRTITNQQIAQEHYVLGLNDLEAGEYELAVAEFELALRYNANLPEAQASLSKAEEKARAQITPTSAARLDAAASLYQQAVTAYEGGKLQEAVTALDELRSLDGGYQRQNVLTMLTTAHYQLGLNAVREDQLDAAAEHFQAVLALKPDDADSQTQLNLVNLYKAALSNWEKDWSATIQALKGLYALAPGYRDVRVRLHDAHVYLAQAYAKGGNWCAASEEYAASVSVLPLEETVDERDDAALWCQATAQAPTPTPTPRPRPTATQPAREATDVPKGTAAMPGATAAPEGTATSPEATAASPNAVAAIGQGRIAFTGFDAVQQRYDIYVVDLAQGAAKLLQENASQPAFAPGGKRLAFRNRHPSYLGLATLDLVSQETGEVTAHQEDSYPSWSPDTTQIVFASDKHGDRKWRLYVISPGEVRGEGQEWAYGEMPAWSPALPGGGTDNSRIAYHGCNEHGDECAIWLMKPGGFEPVRLTTDPSDTAPAWSPGGAQVAFISARNGNWELYVINAAGGKERRLSDNRAADVAPVWSPDGQKLAFLSNRDGLWAIYILEISSGQVQKVIATGDAYPDPVSERLSWAP